MFHEVEVGRGQYIPLNSALPIPTGTVSRGRSYAEVIN